MEEGGERNGLGGGHGDFERNFALCSPDLIATFTTNDSFPMLTSPPPPLLLFLPRTGLKVLFDGCVETVLKLVRLLGAKVALHTSLVGQPGSGRRAALRLACYLCGLELKCVSGHSFFA